jgi:hypothetical protein
MTDPKFCILFAITQLVAIQWCKKEEKNKTVFSINEKGTEVVK